MTNMLLVAERRRRITEAQAARFVALLRELPLTLDLAPPGLDALLAIGHRHGLSAYDAVYLALAEREGPPLATSTRRCGMPLWPQAFLCSSRS